MSSEDDVPPGFGFFYYEVFRDGEVKLFKVLLPATPQISRFINETEAKANRKKDKFLAERDSKQVQELKETTHRFSPNASKKASEIIPEDELVELSEKYGADLVEIDESQFVELYDFDAPIKLIVRTRTPDRDVFTRNLEIFKRLKTLGNFRRLVPQSDDAMAKLDQLQALQPHFGQVIELVKKQILLSKARSRALSVPPILIYGEPGCGKTYFLEQLALAIGLPIHTHTFDGATTDAMLMGSASNWGNSTYGRLFEILCLNKIANPILLLDELDKASNDDHRNALGPLHSLLEPLSAKAVTDISVNITFNASRVTYLATANDASKIPASLRSRFVEFFILPPMGRDAIRVAQGIANKMLEDLDMPGFNKIDDKIVKTIAHLSAREQTHILKQAFASAVADGRLYITTFDLPKSVFICDNDGNDDEPNQTETLH